METKELGDRAAQRLQVVEVRGVKYFVDFKQRELREVVRSGAWKTIGFESEEAESLVWDRYFVFDCPYCLEPSFLSAREEPVICRRCGQDVQKAFGLLVKRIFSGL